MFKVEEMAKYSHSTGMKVIEGDKDLIGHVKDGFLLDYSLF